MQKPKTTSEAAASIAADLEENLETQTDVVQKIDKVREIVAKWEKHYEGSEWHIQECCIDELIAELKVALR